MVFVVQGDGMIEIRYKEFLIMPIAYCTDLSEKWTGQVCIIRDTEAGVKDRTFTLDGTFESKEAGTQRCIAFAKQIIDGEQPGISMDDLP